MNEFSKRLVEIDELLSYLSFEDLFKIPQDLLILINERKDKNYIWKYNPELSLSEQNLNRDTICMLSYINYNYLLNDEEKELAEKIYELNELKIKDSTKSRILSTNSEISQSTNTAETIEVKQEMVEIKENILSKLWKKIKGLFFKA